MTKRGTLSRKDQGGGEYEKQVKCYSRQGEFAEKKEWLQDIPWQN